MSSMRGPNPDPRFVQDRLNSRLAEAEHERELDSIGQGRPRWVFLWLVPVAVIIALAIWDTFAS